MIETDEKPTTHLRGSSDVLRRSWLSAVLVASALGGMLGGCRASDILDVAPPSGVQTFENLSSRSGAEAMYAVAKGNALTYALVGSNQLFRVSQMLTDEFTVSGFVFSPQYTGIDARRTALTAQTTRDGEPGDVPLGSLLSARSMLLLAESALATYEPETDQWKVGEAFALSGYIELYLAEQYCAGVTLDRSLPGGGIEYGMPLTTDSLLGVAEAHFDSAIVHAHEDAIVLGLARTGLARARLGRGHFVDAKAAAADVPTNFIYNIETPASVTYGLPQNFYQQTSGFCSFFNMANRKGGNGLDYITARDPRLVVDSSGQSCDKLIGRVPYGPFYYPAKFGRPSTAIPIANGIEARLIEAEAAYQANDGTWLTKLNALRTTCTTTIGCPVPAPAGSGGIAGLPPLDDPGLAPPSGKTADDARVDLLFRERAFWLFGTGVRLGDMRRLIRQYQRTASTVFPSGTYANGLYAAIPTYGDDVSLTLPTEASARLITNPHYKGCLTSPTSP